MKFLNEIDGAKRVKQDSNNRFVTDAEIAKWNDKADKTYVDSKVQTDVPADAKFTDTITSVNGQIGDIELTADDLDYFDYDTTQYLNVGGALNEINDIIYQFILYVLGPGYVIGNDPTLKEIAELVVGGGGSSGGPIVDLGTFNDAQELFTHAVMNQLPTGYYTFTMDSVPYFTLLKKGLDGYTGTFYDNNAVFSYFDVSMFGEILDLKVIDLGDLSELRVYIDGEIGRKADKTYVDSQDALKADKTYVDSKVQTDVPVGAKFTDTITTINGKTGGISKADIVALGIPAQDTNTTYSEITTAEIDTGTASTLRAITGRRVKYILDKVQGWISGLTKSDVGLSNVDNVKQMPISGGVLENYSEKLVTVSMVNGMIYLNQGNVFQHTPYRDIAYTITNTDPLSGRAHSFTLIVNMGSTVRTLTFPSSVKWQGREIPDLTTASKTYVLTFMTVDGGTNWLGMFGGEF